MGAGVISEEADKGQAKTPAAKWREEGRPDPFGDRYNCERAALTLGHLTDDELANAQFMVQGTIHMQTAAKDRIRWLSRRLETLLAEQDVTFMRGMAHGQQVMPKGTFVLVDSPEIEALRAERDVFKTSEKELSDAYLRIRSMLSAWDTKPGGEDRFEVTEAALNRLKEELELMKTAGIIEVAVRNPNVTEYIRHWEGRALAAERREADLLAGNEINRRTLDKHNSDWTAKLKAAEAEGMRAAADMWQQCFDIVSKYRSSSTYLSHACDDLEGIKPAPRPGG